MVWEGKMRTEVVVFGRRPVPGRVKTRLAVAIGPEAATEIYRALLDHALGEAVATGMRVTLALAGGSSSGGWEAPAGLHVTSQIGSDLGARMKNAFSDSFNAGADAVVLVGSDLPGLSSALICAAFEALGRVPVVLGPAADGGYWTVGQRRPGHDLFTGIPWSTPDTLAATKRRLADLGLNFEKLPVLRDLDTIQDVEAFLKYDSDRQGGLVRAIRGAVRDQRRER